MDNQRLPGAAAHMGVATAGAVKTKALAALGVSVALVAPGDTAASAPDVALAPAPALAQDAVLGLDLALDLAPALVREGCGNTL